MLKWIAVGGMLVAGISAGVGFANAQNSPAMAVFKDPACGCCVKWIEHLRVQGFRVTVTDVDDMDTVKDSNKVPKAARSCHTGTVSGYAIEGHVPAADIKRLLKERPAGVIGLAVPGMPIGSPGMEVPGVKPQAFDVFAFDALGKLRVFASHP